MIVNQLCRGALLGIAVVLGGAGCFSPADDDDDGCSKDTDCAGGRICVEGECQAVSGGGGSAGGGTGGDGGTAGICLPASSACGINGDCCNFREGQGYCVSGRCADSCALNSDCVSGCCAALEGGGNACAPTEVCGVCSSTGSACSQNGDCCNFREGRGYCVSGRCADSCVLNSDCVSGCCALLEGGGRACAPASICGG